VQGGKRRGVECVKRKVQGGKRMALSAKRFTPLGVKDPCHP